MFILKKTLPNVQKGLKRLRKLSFSQVIISAGMPRSASTLLFNALRLCLESKYQEQLVSGYLPDMNWSKLPAAPAYLFKEHKLKSIPLIKYRANYIFYSYRDIRDAMASWQLKSNGTPVPFEKVRGWIGEYYEAKNCNKCLMFKYEDLTQNLEQTVQIITKTLNIEVDIEKIIDQLPKPSVDLTNYGYYTDPKTLFHGGHSSGTKEGQWREILSEEIQRQLLEEFSDWFQENGYELK